MSHDFPTLSKSFKENGMWIHATQALVLCGLIGFSAVGVAQTAPTNGGSNGALVAAAAANAQKPGPGTPLGDLSTFRTTAVDTLRIVDTGDLAAAKKRIKDLELSWDQAEPKMKPLAPQKWETVDVAIDRALKEVRAWSATQAGSREALQALISTIDSMK
jgi:hypothetical protein